MNGRVTMCYSAMVKQHLKSLGFTFKARVQLDLFEDLYRRRAAGEKLKIPRAMDFNFVAAEDKPSITIKQYIDTYSEQAIKALEEDLFAQKKRLADAERKLKEKPTKTAEKEKGIALRKIEADKRRLEKLRSASAKPEDARIYALEYAPVIVWEDGERVIKPMRYLCRPAGFPESFDREYPGCYNARRDSLKKFWKKQYLHHHAILVITSFFENVSRHHYEGRKLGQGEEEENMVVQFKPRGMEEMIVPCIWDKWTDGKSELYSFALITDDPPKEVLATGHDRCPIFLKESNIDRWLRPDTCSEETVDEILDDRQTPYYDHEAVA